MQLPGVMCRREAKASGPTGDLAKQQQVTVEQHHVAAVGARDVDVAVDACHELDRPRALDHDPIAVDGDEPGVTGRAGDLIRVNLS